MAAKGQILPSDCVRQGEQGRWLPARQVKGLFAAPAISPLPTNLRSAPGEGQGVRGSDASEIAKCKLQNANCKLSASNPQSPIPNPSSASPHPNSLAMGEGTAGEDFPTLSEMFPCEPAAEAAGAFSFDSEAASPGGCEEMGTGTSRQAYGAGFSHHGSEPVPISSQPPAADFIAPHGAEVSVLSSIQRRQRQNRKKMLFGLLLVGVVGLVIASLSLALRSNDQPSGETGGPSGSVEDSARQARPQ